MTLHNVKFGVAMRNFTAYPELPDPKKLLDYAVEMEELNFESLWVWDHILLGVEPHFPIIDSLTMLTAVAARTSKIKLGTGVLVLPLRNPLVLAKQLSSIDQISQGRLIVGMASGWYKREFDAVGVPFEKRGNIMDENIEIITRLWTEDMVLGEYNNYNLRNSVMFPKPIQKPRPQILIGGYVDRVLKRAGEKGDGWLTYFYTPESFLKSWGKVCEYAEKAGRDPATLESTNQLPIAVGDSRSEIEGPMLEWLRTEWDYADWSDSTAESAIIGNVDECIEQLLAHIETGLDRIIFVPYKYDTKQIEIISKEIIPRLK